jgi:hypothetical protein
VGQQDCAFGEVDDQDVIVIVIGQDANVLVEVRDPEAPSELALDKRDTMERGVAVEEERKAGDDVRIKVESP